MVPIITATVLLCGQSAPPSAQDAPESRDIIWTNIGPGGGGWIQAIAWSPHDPDILYVGCDVGGFYFSKDAGRHCEIRNRGLHDYSLEVIAPHPKHAGIILLGTESGIHRSADQGRTWQWVRKGFPPVKDHEFSAPIGAIAFDPLQPDVVYAGVGRSRFDKDGAGAIYRSTDAGQSWRLVSAGQLPADAIVRAISVKPGQSATILAATQHGVYRSDDEGKTWSLSSKGLPHRNVAALAFAASAPDVVYASLRTTARGKQPFDGGVCRSDDAGKTWRLVNGAGMPGTVGKRGEGDENFYGTSQIGGLVVDPRDADVVYAGGRSWVSPGVYKTVDGGRHWTLVTRPGEGDKKNVQVGWLDFWGLAVECLALSPARPDRLAFGTAGHVFTTDNKGESWQQRYCSQLPDDRFASTGLETTVVNAVVPDPVNRDRLWFCYADIGLLVSDDRGQSFRRSFQGMAHSDNCFTVVVDPKTPKTVWAATGKWHVNHGDVCRSDDGGQTWQVVGAPKTGLPDGQVMHLVLDIASPANQRRLLATSNGNGIYESNDGARSWHSINGNLPAEASRQPRGLLLDGNDPKHLIVALAGTPETGAGVYATRDGGKKWERLHKTVPFADMTALAAEPRNLGTMYVTARQHYDPRSGKSYPGGVFASRDGGATWKQVLDFRFVQTVTVSPADANTVYVGTTDHPYHDDWPAEGVLKSSDGGATWRRVNVGLSSRNIVCLIVSPHDPSVLLVGTEGNGAFMGKDAGLKRKPAKAPQPE